MPTNNTRARNGGQTQVRIGVLQGIGPIGPPGLKGEQGIQGERGAQGATGARGGFENYQSMYSITSTTTVAPATDQLVAFNTVVYDDLAAHGSTTVFNPTNAGDYMLSCWVQFAAPSGSGDHERTLWFRINAATVIAKQTVSALVTGPTVVNLSFPWRFASGDAIRVYARSGDDASCNIDSGYLAITRMGAGNTGPQGVQGEQGAVGPTGAQGPAGPEGSAGSGYAHYSDLLP